MMQFTFSASAGMTLAYDNDKDSTVSAFPFLSLGTMINTKSRNIKFLVRRPPPPPFPSSRSFVLLRQLSVLVSLQVISFRSPTLPASPP
jgi:hypothetical protein